MLDMTECPDSLVSALIELLVTSVNKQYSHEAERLLAALHVMRPRFRELHIYDVWLMMGRKRYDDAARTLRDLESQTLQAPFNAYVAALLATCLFSLRDPGWQMFANQVLSREEDPESVRLVNLLMGRKEDDTGGARALAGEERAAGRPQDRGERSPFSTTHFLRV